MEVAMAGDTRAASARALRADAQHIALLAHATEAAAKSSSQAQTNWLPGVRVPFAAFGNLSPGLAEQHEALVDAANRCVGDFVSACEFNTDGLLRVAFGVAQRASDAERGLKDITRPRSPR